MKKANNPKSPQTPPKSPLPCQNTPEKQKIGQKSISTENNNCRSLKDKQDALAPCKNKKSTPAENADRSDLSESQTSAGELVNIEMSLLVQGNEGFKICGCREAESSKSKWKPCCCPSEESPDCDESLLTDVQKSFIDNIRKQESLIHKWKEDMDAAEEFLSNCVNDCLCLTPKASHSVGNLNSKCKNSKSKSVVSTDISSCKDKSKITKPTQMDADDCACPSDDTEDYSEGEISAMLDDLLESEGSAVSQMKGVCSTALLGEDVDDDDEEEEYEEDDDEEVFGSTGYVPRSQESNTSQRKNEAVMRTSGGASPKPSKTVGTDREERPAMYGEEEKSRILDLVNHQKTSEEGKTELKASSKSSNKIGNSEGSNSTKGIANIGASEKEGITVGKSESSKNQEVTESRKNPSVKFQQNSENEAIESKVSGKVKVSPSTGTSQGKVEDAVSGCNCGKPSGSQTEEPICRCSKSNCQNKSKKNCNTFLEESVLQPLPGENMESTRIDEQECKCTKCPKEVKSCISKNEQLMCSISTIEQILSVLEQKVNNIENESKSEAAAKEAEKRKGCSGKNQENSKTKLTKKVDKKKSKYEETSSCDKYKQSSTLSKTTSKRPIKPRSKPIDDPFERLQRAVCDCDNEEVSTNKKQETNNKHPQKLVLTISARFEDGSGNSSSPAFQATGTLDLVNDGCQISQQTADED